MCNGFTRLKKREIKAIGNRAQTEDAIVPTINKISPAKLRENGGLCKLSTVNAVNFNHQIIVNRIYCKHNREKYNQKSSFNLTS
jgi:hypothetical protein